MQIRNKLVGIEHLQNWNGKNIIFPIPDLIIESDASSLHGRGAVDNTNNIKMGSLERATKATAHKCICVKGSNIWPEIFSKILIKKDG